MSLKLSNASFRIPTAELVPMHDAEIVILLSLVSWCQACNQVVKINLLTIFQNMVLLVDSVKLNVDRCDTIKLTLEVRQNAVR